MHIYRYIYSKYLKMYVVPTVNLFKYHFGERPTHLRSLMASILFSLFLCFCLSFSLSLSLTHTNFRNAVNDATKKVCRSSSTSDSVYAPTTPMGEVERQPPKGDERRCKSAQLALCGVDRSGRAGGWSRQLADWRRLGRRGLQAPLVWTWRGCNDSSRVPRLAAPHACLLYTSPSPRDRHRSRMPSSA